MRAVRGVISDGFITIVQPHARAGATFHALTCSKEGHQVQVLDIYLPHVNRVVPRNAVQRGRSGHRAEISHLHLSTDADWLMLCECHLGFVVNFDSLTSSRR